jgi:hypothetical protein
MIAILESVTIDVDTDVDGEPRQSVTIRLVNAGAFMPTDELQCLAGAGAIVRVDITPSTAAAALPPMLDNPGE